MATTTVIRQGYDTWVSSSDPTSKHPRDNRLRLDSTTAYAYVYFPLGPELRNVTILSATLYVYGRGTGWGTNTVTVKSIAQGWDAGTLTWNNKPSVGATSATLTQTNPDDPTEWAIDVSSLVQEFASGSRWRGMRLSIGDTTERRFNSLNAPSHKPRLEVRWTQAPAAPVDLSPGGGRAVSTSRPMLTWSNENSPAGTDLTDFEVQIDPAANVGTAVTFTGSDVAELDLEQTAYAGLANAASTQWRVRVKNDSGIWSAWSDWASFKRVDKEPVTILTPGSTVAEYTPPVAWSTPFEQTAWRLIVTELDDTSIVLHDTGRKSGATQDYTIPAKDARTDRRILRDDRDYLLEVRAFDTEDREATTDDPAYSSAFVVFHYEDDPTPDPVVNLTAEQVGFTPYVDLTWQRDTTPDAWTITVNNKAVDTAIPGADLLISGTFYKYRYKDGAPNVPLDFRVKPTVNGGTGPSPVVTVTTKPAGVWVLGPDDIDVLITGKELGDFSMPDRGTTFVLPGSRTPVRVTQGVGGWQGSISGRLVEAAGRTAEGWRNRLLALKKRGESVTLLVGGETFRASIFNVNVAPSRDGGQTRDVSFEFFQIGDIDWLDG
jgi:hypothetical protein